MPRARKIIARPQGAQRSSARLMARGGSRLMEVAEVQSERSLLNEISHDAMNATLESVPVLNVDAPASAEEPVPVAVTLSVQAEDNLAKLINAVNKAAVSAAIDTDSAIDSIILLGRTMDTTTVVALEAQRQADEALAKVANTTTQFEALIADLNTERRAAQSWQERWNARDREVQSLQTQLQEEKDTSKKLKRDLMAASDSLRDSQIKLTKTQNRLTAKMTHKKDQLARKTQELHSTTEALLQSRREILQQEDRLTDELANVNKQLAAKTEEHKDAISSLNQTSRELTGARVRLETAAREAAQERLKWTRKVTEKESAVQSCKTALERVTHQKDELQKLVRSQIASHQTFEKQFNELS